MAIALVCWRSLLRTSWRQAVAVMLLGGVLGAVALASLAGARSTAGAYSRYLTAINASDVQMNVPGPGYRPSGFLPENAAALTDRSIDGYQSWPMLALAS
jgi:hypothetical protein